MLAAIEEEAQSDNADNNIEAVELKPNDSGQQGCDYAQGQQYETYNLFLYSGWWHSHDSDDQTLNQEPENHRFIVPHQTGDI